MITLDSDLRLENRGDCIRCVMAVVAWAASPRSQRPVPLHTEAKVVSLCRRPVVGSRNLGGEFRASAKRGPFACSMIGLRERTSRATVELAAWNLPQLVREPDDA